MGSHLPSGHETRRVIIQHSGSRLTPVSVGGILMRQFPEYADMVVVGSDLAG